jgi:LysM repeat protein
VKFYLIQGKTVIQLPLNPSELKTSEASKNRVSSVINLGDINIPDVRGLNDITFSAFFPRHWSNGCACGMKELKSPISYVNTIMGMKNTKQPIRLVLAGNIHQILKANNNTSCLFLIEDMSYEIKAGEEEDIHYTIKLKQYKNFEPRTVSIAKPKPTPTNPKPKPSITIKPAPRPVAPTPQKRGYTVQPGDSLWEISRRYYGDGSQYMRIANANGINNPSLIRTGQWLVIP